MGRPKLVIDESLVEKLAMIMCTMEEIAMVVGCSVDTLENRFSDIIKEGKAKGKTSLRRFQYLAAEKGNPALLIWLGKQHLGQSDKQEITGRDGDKLFGEMSDEALDKLIESRIKKVEAK